MATATLTAPTAEALAAEFANVLRVWLPESDLIEIDKQNQAFRAEGHGDEYCATGDHCDSNQAMIDAWETLTGAEPELVDDEDEDLPLGCIPPDVTLDLMNKAWGLAKERGFTPPTSCQACTVTPATVPVTIDECGSTMICRACADELGSDRSKAAFYCLPDDPRTPQEQA